MTDVTELLDRARADLDEAQRRYSALEVIHAAAAGLAAADFAPDVSIDAGRLVLTVDVWPDRPAAPYPWRERALDPERPPFPMTPEGGDQNELTRLTLNLTPVEIVLDDLRDEPVTCQEVEAEPEPESEPEHVAKPAAPAPVERITGPFSEAEDATILALAEQDKQASEIAAALNRAPQGVASRLRYLNDQRSGPKPKPVQTARGSAEVHPEDDMSNGMKESEREVRRRVRALGYSDPWTAEADFKLVHSLLRGDGLMIAAEKIRIEKDVAKQRWDALCPDRSFDAQTVLLEVLQKIADEAHAARSAAESAA